MDTPPSCSPIRSGRPADISRRTLLGAAAGVGLAAGTGGFGVLGSQAAAAPPGTVSISNLTRRIALNSTTLGTKWFSPATAMLPTVLPTTVLMLAQPVYSGSGTDNFGSVHASLRNSDGSWKNPLERPIPSLARALQPNGWEEAYVGMLPQYHPDHNVLLAMGTNVWYENNLLVSPYDNRHIVYATYDATQGAFGSWSSRKVLTWSNPEASGIYYCSLLQRVILANGDVLVPVQYMAASGTRFKSSTLRCSFDGELLAIVDEGTALENPVGRGIFEPSLTVYDGTYFLTLRAEDGRGYLSTSSDGLSWGAKTAWAWDDGQPLEMSSTQQHWLTHSDGLFLVYTRKTADNHNVFRWRSPLFVAEVDPVNRCLIRSTEHVVFPMDGDGTALPNSVPTFGNFSVLNVTPTESIVTDTSNHTYAASITWSIPNTLV